MSVASCPKAFAGLEDFASWCEDHRKELCACRPDIPEPGIPYAKQSLSIEGYELMLLRWPPNSTCLPHDHGNAGGMVFTIEGSITEHRLYPQKQTLEMTEGSSLTTCTACIHYMESPKGCTTVHWYSKLGSSFVVFDPQNQKQWRVREGAIAMPPHPDDIIQELAWQPPW